MRMYPRRALVSLASLLSLLSCVASAQAQAPAAAQQDPAAQAYAAAIEGAEPAFGLLRLYRKQDQLLCELGAEHLPW